MSAKDEIVKSDVMSERAKGNDGKVDKGDAAGQVQGSVDRGEGAKEGKARGMSNEGKKTGGKYSEATSNTQGTVDKAY